MKLTPVILSIVLTYVTFAFAEDYGNCETPAGNAGQCVPPKQCFPLLFKALTLAQNSSDIKQDLQSRRCKLHDSTHGICCETDKQFKLPYDHCGVPLSESRMLSSVADVYEIPWIALLVYRDTNDDSFKVGSCYGALISERYVLTTANCLKPRNQMRLELVRLGEHTLSTDVDCSKYEFSGESDDCTTAIQVPIESTVLHDAHESGNDIGLVRLAEKITFNDHIRPICLPIWFRKENASTNRPVFTLPGWYRSSDILRRDLAVPLESDQCRNQPNAEAIFDDRKHICAGRSRTNCTESESGLLLTANGEIGAVGQRHLWSEIIFGLASVDFTRCDSGEAKNGPIVFTKVEPHVEWILDNMKL